MTGDIMEQSTIGMQDWVKAIQEATNDMALTVMGLSETCSFGASESGFSSGDGGALISLANANHSVQIGILADEDGCKKLSGKMLGLESDESELSKIEVSDTMGELVNIIAGGVKRIMSEATGSIQLGLPVFVTGHVESSDKIETVVIPTQIAGIDTRLMILKKRVP